MIFYHNQLMKSTNQLKLFLVSNPVPFERYEDHEAAIYIQLHELIADAKKDKEDPIALIETYLGTTYTLGDSDNEMASFIFQTGEMMSALNVLRENWHALDESIPGDSVMYGGVSREEATQLYSQLTLRTYLEALTAIANDYE